MSDDPHYYVAGYSVDDDPYCASNGVLINKLGITNTQDLNEVEAELAAVGIKKILDHPPLGKFSAKTLSDIHYELFSDIYPWAGEFRKVDIAKGVTYFEKHHEIQRKLDDLFSDCAKHDFFKNIDEPQVAQEIATFLIELNRIHPFREGNGRAQRSLLSLMAMRTGYDIRWEGVSNDAMRNACIDGLSGNYNSMRRIIHVALTPILSNFGAGTRKTPRFS